MIKNDMPAFFLKKKNKSQLALIVSLLVILLYILDINFNIFFQKTPLEQNLKEKPTSISKSVEIIKYDKSGERSHQINATRITNIDKRKNKPSNKDSIKNKTNSYVLKLSEPRIKVFSKNGEITQINASTGNINEDGSILYLNGNILMTTDSSILTVKATELKFNTFSKKIYASNNVIINTLSSTTKANKMEGDLKNQKIYLIGDVSSVLNKKNTYDEDLIISADKITFLKTVNINNQKYDNFIAHGKPVNMLHKKNNRFDTIKASAEIIEFQSDENIMKLKNNVLISKSDYEVSGDEIIYYIEDRRISANNEISKSNNRVKAIIKNTKNYKN